MATCFETRPSSAARWNFLPNSNFFSSPKLMSKNFTRSLLSHLFFASPPPSSSPLPFFFLLWRTLISPTTHIVIPKMHKRSKMTRCRKSMGNGVTMRQLRVNFNSYERGEEHLVLLVHGSLRDRIAIHHLLLYALFPLSAWLSIHGSISSLSRGQRGGVGKRSLRQLR